MSGVADTASSAIPAAAAAAQAPTLTGIAGILLLPFRWLFLRVVPFTLSFLYVVVLYLLSAVASVLLVLLLPVPPQAARREAVSGRTGAGLQGEAVSPIPHCAPTDPHIAAEPPCHLLCERRRPAGRRAGLPILPAHKTSQPRSCISSRHCHRQACISPAYRARRISDGRDALPGQKGAQQPGTDCISRVLQRQCKLGR